MRREDKSRKPNHENAAAGVGGEADKKSNPMFGGAMESGRTGGTTTADGLNLSAVLELAF